MNNNIKITKYDNETFSIQYHSFNKYKNNVTKNKNCKTNIIRKPFNKRKQDDFNYMTTKQYMRTLRRKKKELEQLDFDPKFSIFLTLTSLEKFSWIDINKKANNFLKSLRRHFKFINYIKTFECFENDIHFHIHLIIIFKDAIPKAFNIDWIKKHWKYGIFRFEHIYNIYGLYNYFTDFKFGNLNKENHEYTKYPQWIQIITFSRGIPKLNKETNIVNKDDLIKIKNDLVENYIVKHGRSPKCSYLGHEYIDKETGEIKYCLDNEYWH